MANVTDSENHDIYNFEVYQRDPAFNYFGVKPVRSLFYILKIERIRKNRRLQIVM